MLVVNKPPFIVIHEGGGYFYNTLQNVIKYELNKHYDLKGII